MDMVDDATSRCGLRFEPHRDAFGARCADCGPGLSSTGCRWRSTRTGRTSTCESRPSRSCEGAVRDDAVRPDVRAAGDPDHRGEFATGQRAGGTRPRHPSGPAGEEAAASGDSRITTRRMPFLVDLRRRPQCALCARPRRPARTFTRRCPRGWISTRSFASRPRGRVSHDWVVRHDNRLLQVERHGRYHPPSRSTVLVCEDQDGHLELWYRAQRLPWTEITGQVPTPVCPRPAAAPAPPLVAEPLASARPASLAARLPPGTGSPVAGGSASPAASPSC